MLPKAYRLKRQQDFARVYKRGSALAFSGFVLYRKENGGNTRRIGFSVSKKIGNAVNRNRIKRRFRHAVRENLNWFIPGYDYVFIVRTAARSQSYDRLCSQIRRAMKDGTDYKDGKN